LCHTLTFINISIISNAQKIINKVKVSNAPRITNNKISESSLTNTLTFQFYNLITSIQFKIQITTKSKTSQEKGLP